MIAKTFHYTFKAMGGPCRVSLISASEAHAQQVRKKIQQEVWRLEAKYSRFRNDSLLNQLNSGQLNGTKLDSETCGLLNYVAQCFSTSDGLFDPTVGVLKEVWNFSSNHIPKPEQIFKIKHRIGWQKVKWDGECLQIPDNMLLDLGGVVKEFAADRARIILQQAAMAGLVNLAGDIAVNGLPDTAEHWSVAIRHPRKSGAIATIGLANAAIAGSGDYERYIDCQGQRYCHLLRPDTGFPATDGLISVTVLAESCLVAGTVSTVAMLKGAAGIKWLEEMAMPYLAIDKNLKLYGSIEVY